MFALNYFDISFESNECSLFLKSHFTETISNYLKKVNYSCSIFNQQKQITNLINEV